MTSTGTTTHTITRTITEYTLRQFATQLVAELSARLGQQHIDTIANTVEVTIAKTITQPNDNVYVYDPRKAVQGPNPFPCQYCSDKRRTVSLYDCENWWSNGAGTFIDVICKECSFVGYRDHSRVYHRGE